MHSKLEVKKSRNRTKSSIQSKWECMKRRRREKAVPKEEKRILYKRHFWIGNLYRAMMITIKVSQSYVCVCVSFSQRRAYRIMFCWRVQQTKCISFELANNNTHIYLYNVFLIFFLSVFGLCSNTLPLLALFSLRLTRCNWQRKEKVNVNVWCVFYLHIPVFILCLLLPIDNFCTIVCMTVVGSGPAGNVQNQRWKTTAANVN